MTSTDIALARAPDLELDLTSCDAIGPHGLPVPVVVSLARRPDRWDMAERNLLGRGVPRLIKAPAVDGQTLTEAQFQALLADPTAPGRPLDDYLQLTRPAIGCYLSHLAIWKRFLASGAERILIMEDDAVFAAGYAPDRARSLLETLPPDADLVLLGGTIMDGLGEPTANPSLIRAYYFNGTFGYLLTRQGARKLLPLLVPLRTHIDNQISQELVRNRDELHVYCAEPRLFEHDFSVWSDVYVPVTDEARANASLAARFEQARADLIAEGAALFRPYAPPSTTPDRA